MTTRRLRKTRWGDRECVVTRASRFPESIHMITGMVEHRVTDVVFWWSKVVYARQAVLILERWHVITRCNLGHMKTGTGLGKHWAWGSGDNVRCLRCWP